MQESTENARHAISPLFGSAAGRRSSCSTVAKVETPANRGIQRAKSAPRNQQRSRALRSGARSSRQQARTPCRNLPKTPVSSSSTRLHSGAAASRRENPVPGAIANLRNLPLLRNPGLAQARSRSLRTQVATRRAAAAAIPQAVSLRRLTELPAPAKSSRRGFAAIAGKVQTPRMHLASGTSNSPTHKDDNAASRRAPRRRADPVLEEPKIRES